MLHSRQARRGDSLKTTRPKAAPKNTRQHEPTKQHPTTRQHPTTKRHETTTQHRVYKTSFTVDRIERGGSLKTTRPKAAAKNTRQHETTKQQPTTRQHPTTKRHGTTQTTSGLLDKLHSRQAIRGDSLKTTRAKAAPKKLDSTKRLNNVRLLDNIRA